MDFKRGDGWKVFKKLNLSVWAKCIQDLPKHWQKYILELAEVQLPRKQVFAGLAPAMLGIVWSDNGESPPSINCIINNNTKP